MKSAIKRYNIKLLLACLFLLAALPGGLYSQTFQDDALRANYLVNFVDFVQWNPQREGETAVGVIGAPEVLAELRRLSAAKRVKGRIISVRELDHGDTIDGLDLLYVGSGKEPMWQAVIDQSKRHAVVTVGEDEGFLDAGGIIKFVVRKNRLRFALNHEAATNYQLGLSSKLARLAVR